MIARLCILIYGYTYVPISQSGMIVRRITAPRELWL